MDDEEIRPRSGPASGEDEVVEVEATPIGPGTDVEIQTGGGEQYGAPPRVTVRRFEVQQHGGGGCCVAGCLGMGFLLFLLYRGFVSLF